LNEARYKSALGQYPQSLAHSRLLKRPSNFLAPDTQGSVSEKTGKSKNHFSGDARAAAAGVELHVHQRADARRNRERLHVSLFARVAVKTTCDVLMALKLQLIASVAPAALVVLY